MMANQRMVASDGKEVVLFPLQYMNISQGELTSSNMSHYNTYNMDFLGWDSNGRVYNCPLYAPCTLKIVDLWDYSGSHTITYESTDVVHFADGTLDYLTIEFTHDNNPPVSVIGYVFTQGDLIYHTGTFGQVTGDHVHMCAGKGHYDGYEQRTGGHYDLKNRCHLYEALCVNDTFIINGDNYNWLEWTEPTPISGNLKSKFPWVLYSKKLRERV